MDPRHALRCLLLPSLAVLSACSVPALEESGSGGAGGVATSSAFSSSAFSSSAFSSSASGTAVGSGGYAGEGGRTEVGGRGGVAPDPCEGVVCNTPPSPCAAALGTCIDGECDYPGAPGTEGTACDANNPCTDAVCHAGECVIGVECGTPPAPHCADSSTRRVYVAGGTCAGTCSYSYTDVPCTGGCQNGQCLGACTNEIVTLFKPLSSGDIKVVADSGEVHVVLTAKDHGAPNGAVQRTFYLSQTTTGGWVATSLHNTDQMGSLYRAGVAIAVDSQSSLHAALAIKGSVFHFQETTAGFDEQFVGIGYGEEFVISDIIFDASNNPQFAFAGNHFGLAGPSIWHAQRNSGSWSLEHVKGFSIYDLNDNGRVWMVSMALDMQGIPLLDYFHTYWHPQTLPKVGVMAKPVNGPWQQTIDFVPGWRASLAKDSNGAIHWVTGSGGSCNVYQHGGTPPAFSLVGTAPACGRAKFDSVGNLYVLDDDQTLYRRTNGVWSSHVISTATGVSYTDFSIDASGVVHAVAFPFPQNLGHHRYARICPW